MGPEQALCALMADILDVPRVEPDEDFFELGGHSVLAVQLVCRARASLGLSLKLADIIATPTAAQLLRTVRRPPVDRTPVSPPGHRVRPMTHDDLPSILRICTITSREHARGDRFTAEHVIPLLYAEPFVMIDGAYGFIVEEGSRVVGYAIGVIDLPAMHDRLSAYVRARIGRVLSAYAGALVRGQMRWPLRQHRQFLAQMFGCWNVGPAAAEMRDVFRRMFSEAHFDAQVRDCCHLQVDPESRRKGIGVVLVSAWTEFLRAQGAAGVAFNVRRFQSFDELLDAGAPQESGRLLAELGFSDAGGGRWVLRFADARTHAAAS